MSSFLWMNPVRPVAASRSNHNQEWDSQSSAPEDPCRLSVCVGSRCESIIAWSQCHSCRYHSLGGVDSWCPSKEEKEQMSGREKVITPESLLITSLSLLSSAHSSSCLTNWEFVIITPQKYLKVQSKDAMEYRRVETGAGGENQNHKKKKKSELQESNQVESNHQHHPHSEYLESENQHGSLRPETSDFLISCFTWIWVKPLSSTWYFSQQHTTTATST